MRTQQVIPPVIGGGAIMQFKLTLAIIASLVAAPAVAADGPARGIYVGAFGGGGFSTETSVAQLGTVFFIEAQGGPLAVNASGKTDSGSAWLVGGQIGYEMSYSSAVLPAFELEGFYLSAGTRRATLQNPTDRGVEQTFDDTFAMSSSVFLANLVLSFPTAHRVVTPYIGGGIGAARVTVNGASSLQLNPAEGGVNHFNSGPDSSVWTFAAQAKAGVRVALGSNAFVFGEYRYLYLGSADQIFGPTVYPAHAATTAWTVRFGDTSYHLGAVGLGFNF
jgi:opacity protein-like surface antigen